MIVRARVQVLEVEGCCPGVGEEEEEEKTGVSWTEKNFSQKTLTKTAFKRVGSLP